MLVRDGVVVINATAAGRISIARKLVRAVRAACHKRPVDGEQITMLVEDVMDALEAQFEKEIPSRASAKA
jgi:transcriptional repressor NrdR